MPKILFADFETRSIIDLKKQGADKYARDPSTEVMAFGYAFDDGPVKVNEIFMPPPTEVLDHVYSGGQVVAHNGGFEWVIWNKCWRRYFPNLPLLSISQLQCTMVMSYAMGLPGSLEKAAPAMGITTEKDMKGQRVMMQLCQPKETLANGQPVFFCPIENQDKFARLYSYCAQDVEVERQLYSRLLPLSKEERELWEIDHRINQRGVRVDIPSALEALSIVDIENKRLNEEIREVTNNAVATTNANKQLTDWINSQGVETEGVAKSDIADLLEKADLPRNVRQALQIRKDAAKSSTAKFATLINRTSVDRRMRSTLQYHGAAATGRWAGRGFQLHNLPRPKLSQKEIDQVFEILN